MTELAETRPRNQGAATSVSREMLRRLLVSVAATAATAATAYLVRKAADLWEEEAMPKIRERGGGEAVVKDAFAKASELFDSASTTIVEADAVTALKEKAEEISLPGSSAPADADEPEIQPVEITSDPDREAERRERRRRREQRQQALKTSAPTRGT